MDGRRAIEDNIKKAGSRIGVNPIRYVNVSFGVPGIRNIRNTSKLRRLVFIKIGSAANLFMGIKRLTSRIPKSRVK